MVTNVRKKKEKETYKNKRTRFSNAEFTHRKHLPSFQAIKI